jgi:hypothetical protein
MPYYNSENNTVSTSISFKQISLHNTSLATPLFIEVYAPIQDIQRTYICVVASFHDFDV